MNGDTESDENQIRDVPYGWWLTGTTLLSIGILLVCAPTLMTLQALAGGLLIVIGFLIVMFVPAITINIDRMSRTLQVCSRSLLISRAKEFQLQDIASIDAEESDDGGTFRLVITECDGTVTPLRSHYGSWNRELQRRLWKMTGVSGAAGSSGSLTGALQMLTGRDEIVNQEMQDRQELMTAPGKDVLESADVSWQIQSIGMGRVPLTRWFSPDFKMQDAFVFIIQKSPSTNPLSRLLSRGIIGRRGILASMAMHGFSDVDAPGKSGARLLDVMALEPHFAVITSDESAVQEILDHSIVRTLIDWATRHPIGGIRRLPHDFKITDSGDLGALAVLYGPQGVYAATAGTLASEPLTELGKTGMKLVGAKNWPDLKRAVQIECAGHLSRWIQSVSTQKKRADGEVSAGETNVDFRPHLVVNPSSSVRDQPRFTMSETFIAAGSHQADGKAITPVGQAPEHSEQTIPRWSSQSGGMEAEKARQMKELPEEHQRLTKLLAETLEAHDSARLGIDASHICSTLETNLSQHHRSLILASDEIARVTESVKDIRLSVCTAKASGVSQ